MSPSLAFHVLTWVALVVLFFALAAVLREVRLLRGIVLRNTDGFGTAEPEVYLGAGFATGGPPRIVLAADSGCPLCQELADRLMRRAPGAVLLTHENPGVWTRVGARLDVVTDRDSWRMVSHLAPPVLMLVDGSARVRRMTLPVRVEEADAVLDEWQTIVAEETTGAADARTHS